MRLMVTGTAGFIGSHLSQRLISDGHEILGVDNLDPYYDVEIKKRNLAQLNDSDNFQFVETDINDINILEMEEAENIDIILHLAAKAGVRESFSNPVGYANANIKGTINILEFARKNEVKKIVFASSSSVYGDSSKVPYNENETGLYCISPYGMSKLTAESYCKMYSRLYNLDLNALRFFTVYGPRQRPDMAINKFIKSIIEGREITVYGNGETYRDYTYIDDILNGIIGAMNYFSGFNIFNLGNGKPIKLSEMINTIGELLDIKPILNHIPVPPGEMKGTCADISKAKKLLTYSPHTSFRDGVANEIKWIRELEK